MGKMQPESKENSTDRPALFGGCSVVLRPLGVNDVEKIAKMQSEPSVARWWGPPDEAQLLREAAGGEDAKPFAVERDGDLVGLIQYYEEDTLDFRHAGIDIFIATHAQGHGLGTDAVRTLASYLIDERGHHRLVIDPAAQNAAAIHTYEKIGFRAVGLMREYWRSPDGSWQDGLLMDLLARELIRT